MTSKSACKDIYSTLFQFLALLNILLFYSCRSHYCMVTQTGVDLGGSFVDINVRLPSTVDETRILNSFNLYRKGDFSQGSKDITRAWGTFLHTHAHTKSST